MEQCEILLYLTVNTKALLTYKIQQNSSNIHDLNTESIYRIPDFGKFWDLKNLKDLKSLIQFTKAVFSIPIAKGAHRNKCFRILHRLSKKSVQFIKFIQNERTKIPKIDKAPTITWCGGRLHLEPHSNWLTLQCIRWWSVVLIDLLVPPSCSWCALF